MDDNNQKQMSEMSIKQLCVALIIICTKAYTFTLCHTHTKLVWLYQCSRPLPSSQLTEDCDRSVAC